jgi:hypothetical protein
MSHYQENPTGVIKNFSVTAGLSFSLIFMLFILMSGCHGEYHPVNENHHSGSAQVDHTPKKH